MLSNIDLDIQIDKKALKQEVDYLKEKLKALQLEIKDLDIPVLVVFEGWSASGKGTLISKLLSPLDPRYVNVYTTGKINEDEQMRPFLWKYATKLPSKGRMCIYDKSWHRLFLAESQAKLALTHKEVQGFFYDVNSFEKRITDSGVLVIKLFLHISKDEQKRRFKELEKNNSTLWRVDEADKLQNKNYDEQLEKFENMLIESSTEKAKWEIIEANDRNYAAIKMYKIIIDRLEKAISHKQNVAIQSKTKETVSQKKSSTNSILGKVDLDKNISNQEYKEKLKYYQNKISELGFKLYSKRRPVVLVFEGWDAAGKGGNIKRLTEHLDPRGYEVISVPAPTRDELSHHYFWRFWNKIPKDGHLAIFDRSWYGRVLVERIESFCTTDEWKKAYMEINDFEKHMYNHGTIILKFWIDIDKDEQLKRFEKRQADPLKHYKITDEDWRNREKWDDYVVAIDEMLEKTDTDFAPWIIVESNNKKYARIKTLQIVVDKLTQQLE